MNNKVFESRILYWHEKEPSMKLFGVKSPLYFAIKYADTTKGISWLGTQILSDFVDGLAYGYLALKKGRNLDEAENSEEAEKSKILTKPVLDFLNNFNDRLIDSEISGNDKFSVNGSEILITRDEIKQHAGKRNRKLLRTREDVVETIKDFIAYKRDLFGSVKQENSTFQVQQITESSSRRNKPKRKPIKYLVDVFETTSKYIHIMDLLVEKKYCNTGNYIWVNEKDSNSGTIIYLLKYLHTQGYYKENKKLTNKEVVEIAQNTFGITFSESHAKQCKLEDKKITVLIPLASTIK